MLDMFKLKRTDSYIGRIPLVFGGVIAMYAFICAFGTTIVSCVVAYLLLCLLAYVHISSQYTEEDNLLISSSWVNRLIQYDNKGMVFPRGREAQHLMYSSYLSDIALGKNTFNPTIPKHSDFKDDNITSQYLRVMTFNVHFWRLSFSGAVDESTSDNIDQIVKIVSEQNPDVLLLQEVPVRFGERAVEPERLNRLRDIGYNHITLAASSTKFHTLPQNFPIQTLAGVQLCVAVCSKLPLTNCEKISLGDSVDSGYAICGRVKLSTKTGSPRSIGFISAHLSVRCGPEVRLNEAKAIISHVDAKQAADDSAMWILGGDFNQAYSGDYSSEAWTVLAKDLQNAKVPLSDGVVSTLTEMGWKRAAHRDTSNPESLPRALPFTAWNGTCTDYIWHKSTSAKVNTEGVTQIGLRCVNSWPVYSDASDHLPVIADYIID